MIVAKKKSVKTTEQKYGKYFLASEAPGDDEELVPGSPDRINMKVVSVRPDNRQRSDFSTTGNDENTEEDDLPEVVPQEQEPENTDGGVGDDITTTNDADVDTTDYTQTPDTTTTDTVSAEPDLDPEPESPTDTTDTDQEDYTQVDDTGNDTVSAEPDLDPEPEDQTDQEDYTQVDSTPGNDNTDDDNNDEKTDDTNQRPGIDFDSMRKYILYKEYSRLRNTVDTYIEKLEASMSDDYESNHVIKTATEKMREVHSLLTDYMLMKFEACNYVQNLLFYQQQIATINLIFKLLKTVEKKSNVD